MISIPYIPNFPSKIISTVVSVFAFGKLDSQYKNNGYDRKKSDFVSSENDIDLSPTHLQPHIQGFTLETINISNICFFNGMKLKQPPSKSKS